MLNFLKKTLQIICLTTTMVSFFAGDCVYASGEAKDVTNGILTIRKDNDNNEDNAEEGIKVNITYKADGIEEMEIGGYNEATGERDKPIYLSKEVIDSLFNIKGNKTEVNLSFNYLVNGKAITTEEDFNALANKNILFTGTNTGIGIDKGINLNMGSTNQESNSVFGMIGVDLTSYIATTLFENQGIINIDADYVLFIGNRVIYNNSVYLFQNHGHSTLNINASYIAISENTISTAMNQSSFLFCNGKEAKVTIGSIDTETLAINNNNINSNYIAYLFYNVIDFVLNLNAKSISMDGNIIGATNAYGAGTSLYFLITSIDPIITIIDTNTFS